jgi:NADPH:quinone reductase-like Zn-dependent oxidoreductase
MRAITYTQLGGPSVLELVERPIPEPGEGEVRIRVLVSGVNPTDWKSRSGTTGGAVAEPTVPNHDGAGVVDKLGAGVAGFSAGDRVWVTLAGDGARRAAPPRNTPSSLPDASSRCPMRRTSSLAPASASPPPPHTAR